MIVSILNDVIRYGEEIEGATILKITAEEYSLINSGIAKIEDGELVIDQTLLIERDEKIAEQSKQSQILTEYPIERQLSILTKALVELSTDRQLQDMITFISSLDNTDVQPTK